MDNELSFRIDFLLQANGADFQKCTFNTILNYGQFIETKHNQVIVPLSPRSKHIEE